MRAVLSSPEHIGQVVAFGRAHVPNLVVVDGAEALARANIVGLVKRYHLDLASDWESRLARKFGGFEDLEQYVRLCVVESLQPCTLTAGSIGSMCGCLDYHSRDCPEWRNSLARLFLIRIGNAACEKWAPTRTPDEVVWDYKR